MPFKLSPQDMGNFDLGSAIKSGLGNYNLSQEAKYKPQMMEAQINELKGRAQKNMMMGKLFESLMNGGGFGGQGGGAEGMGGEPSSNQGDEGASMGGGGNLKAAVLKAFTGIDPFLQSPQQAQNMKIKGQTEAQANKTNLTLGSSNVVREYLQDKMEMPKEYLGGSASINIAKDALAARLGDKAAQARQIKAAVIHKLLPEYVGAQLGSQGIKTTVPALAHQEAAIKQGWGHIGKFATEHMTPEMHAEADRLHNKYVQEINKRREAFNKSGGKERPSSQRKESSSAKKFSWSDISHTAKSRGITENDVIDRLAKKNNMSVDEFMNMVEERSQ